MAGKSNGVDAAEWARAPPKRLPLGARILKTIYDPDEKTFLGRTPKRWAIMIVFYAIFYAVLALMFSLCMGGLFMCLEEGRPMYLMEKSLIGGNPGVTSRPRPRDEVAVRYSLDNSTGYETYVQELSKFMEIYANESHPYASKAECSEQDNFGYPSSPCFFIKLNKIYGWEPQFYGAEDADLPVDLLDYVTQLPEKERNQIWVSCWDEGGENSTRLEYPWGRALPGSYYPYTNQQHYLSPLVAVKIAPLSNNTLVTVRCRAWAKNIVYNKSLKEASGYARIQLRIDGGGDQP